MSINEEKLMAYADGELGAAERAEIEAALAQDQALREKVEAHQRLRGELSTAFDGALTEPVPERLNAAVNATPRTAEVVRLAERRPAKWSAREWSAMAASVAAGLLIGVGVMNTQTPLITPTDGGLMARGSLAAALDAQLASDDDSGAVRIGLSFRAQDGRYCRTFDLTRGETSGLACRDDEGWAVAMTSHSAAGGEIRMAGASEEILAAVDQMIDGEPLDAAGEQRARDAGWRVP